MLCLDIKSSAGRAASEGAQPHIKNPAVTNPTRPGLSLLPYGPRNATGACTPRMYGRAMAWMTRTN